MGNYSECVKCNNLITCNRKEYKADRCLHFEERKNDFGRKNESEDRNNQHPVIRD